MGSQPPAFKSPYAPPGTPPDVRKQIHFATDGVQPPSSIYLDVNDQFQVGVYTIDVSPAVFFRYRILNPSGEIISGQERFLYTLAGRGPQIFVVKLTEGFLLSLHVTLDASQPSNRGRGQTRVNVELLRPSGFGSGVLAEGYLDGTAFLSWPNALNEPSTAGQGWMHSITGTAPAAGAEISETVPFLARFGLATFRFQLTTSVTVATRGVTLLIDDGVNILFAIEAPSTQAASLVQQYNYGVIGARADKVFGTNVSIPVPPVKLVFGYRIRTLTSGLQATDQYTAPQYLVEDWLTA